MQSISASTISTRPTPTALAAGRLEVVIGQTFSLEHADQAHAAIESRSAVGRTLLTV
ncbi:zinc-binding dehydrogenase [Nocardia sp. CNY236]|uniref:zinc-binding dehydrogenase n=1 Tax=Nocardia sp. CNY236 TaxID=1169152 RepID=UPI00041CD03B|nr:zinc-binding dehydrogenase [Nocardia sp. CNY236]